VFAYTSRTPLAISVREDDLDLFRLLLRRGADQDITSRGEAPVSRAARLSRHTMLQELLEHGADPNVAGSVAVVSAAQVGNIHGMLLLIEHGANIHAQEGVPGKALHLAAEYTHIDMIKLLLGKGVDVNAWGGEYG